MSNTKDIERYFKELQKEVDNAIDQALDEIGDKITNNIKTRWEKGIDSETNKPMKPLAESTKKKRKYLEKKENYLNLHLQKNLI